MSKKIPATHMTPSTAACTSIECTQLELLKRVSDQRDQLLSILECMPYGVYIVDKEYALEYANPALTRKFGAYENRKCFEYLHGAHEPCPGCQSSLVFEGKTMRREWTSPSGHTYDLFDFPLIKPDGSIRKVEVFHDITPLISARSHLELAASLARVGYWDWSIESDTLFWSDETYRCFGYEPNSIVPSYAQFLESIHPDDREYVNNEVQRSIATGTHYFADFRYFDIQRRLRTGRAIGRVHCNPDGSPQRMYGAMQDITSQKDTEARLEFLSNHDPLTGLANRHLFRFYFDQARFIAERDQQRLALLLIDLDHFKAFNDSLGHPVGDHILQEVANRLKHLVKEIGAFCRFGGDEFLLLSTGFTQLDSIEQMATSIFESLQTPVCIEGHELVATLSLGVAIWPDDASEFDDLLKCADVAMYRAKSEGRNTFRFFTEEMNEQAKRFHQIRNALSLALTRQEFELHYQPQIQLDSGRVTGVEALLRWHPMGHATIPPAQFIPVAEESGLIIALGDWVLEQACRQAVEWQQQGLPAISMAVNLSAVQFKRGNIEQSVRRALSASGLDARLLDLEFTETLLIDDASNALETVKRLKAFGVSLSIDDFGTGYSSLAYLKRFSVNTLKIDQSFIRDLVSNADDRSIVQAIIGMAHNLKLHVLAEGVETAELSALLSSFGCEQAQGHYFARPMPAAEFADWLRAHHNRYHAENAQ